MANGFAAGGFARGKGAAIRQLDPVGSFFGPIERALVRRQQAQQFERSAGLDQQRIDIARQAASDRQNTLDDTLLNDQRAGAEEQISDMFQLITDSMTKANQAGTQQHTVAALQGVVPVLNGLFERANRDPAEIPALLELAMAGGQALSAGEEAAQTAAGTVTGKAAGLRGVGFDETEVARGLGVAPSEFAPRPPTAGESVTSTITALQNARDASGARLFTDDQIRKQVGAHIPPSPLEGKATNILLPDGTRATGRELPDGSLQIVQSDGAMANAPPGSLKMAVTSEAGQLPDAVLQRNVIQAVTTAKNFSSIFNDTINELQNPNVVLGTAGGFLRFAQSATAQVKQLADAFGADDETGHFNGRTGQELTSRDMLNPDNYDFTGLQAIAAAGTRVKANAVAMAYIVARSRDPNGRLSDFDVQASLQTLGFESNDKEIMAQILTDRWREINTNTKNFVESVTGETLNFDIEPLPVTGPQGPQAPAVKPLTQDDLQAIIDRGGR